MEISSFLRSFKGRRLFFPSHGGGSGLSSSSKRLMNQGPGQLDLPELPDFGGPLLSEGVVADSQKISAKIFGAKRCWYGVNGATGLLQAALLSISKPGGSILMPRNAHQSAIYACILGNLKPVFFDLPFLEDRGHFNSPDLNWIKKILNNLPKDVPPLQAVLLVNPTYHGYSSKIESLILEFHKLHIPVVIDEAHGTHFLSKLGEFPSSALCFGADLVIHSLHKSAGGLCQTAILWQQGDLVSSEEVEKSLKALQTSSPSSLLLASCESSIRELSDVRVQKKLLNRLRSAKNIFLRLSDFGLPLLRTDDPLKLILHTASEGISGFDADEFFISRGVFAELPEPGCLTFCLGFSNHRGIVRQLKETWNALISIKKRKSSLNEFTPPPFPLIMKPEFSCFSALKAKNKIVDLADSIGEVSAEMICPYPPGTPMLIPGELINEDYVNWLKLQRTLWPNQIPSKLRVML